jgi:hypothetical protein
MGTVTREVQSPNEPCYREPPANHQQKKSVFKRLADKRNRAIFMKKNHRLYQPGHMDNDGSFPMAQEKLQSGISAFVENHPAVAFIFALALLYCNPGQCSGQLSISL